MGVPLPGGEFCPNPTAAPPCPSERPEIAKRVHVSKCGLWRHVIQRMEQPRQITWAKNRLPRPSEATPISEQHVRCGIQRPCPGASRAGGRRPFSEGVVPNVQTGRCLSHCCPRLRTGVQGISSKYSEGTREPRRKDNTALSLVHSRDDRSAGPGEARRQDAGNAYLGGFRRRVRLSPMRRRIFLVLCFGDSPRKRQHAKQSGHADRINGLVEKHVPTYMDGDPCKLPSIIQLAATIMEGSKKKRGSPSLGV